MGLCASTLTEQQKKERAVEAAIQKELDMHAAEEEQKVKLLLLGAGESGKSTIFKQMKILYGDPMTNDDRKEFVKVIHSNVLSSMKSLLEAHAALTAPAGAAPSASEVVEGGGDDTGAEDAAPPAPRARLDLPDIEATAERDLILKMDDSERITPEVAVSLETLWKDEGVKQCFQHRHLFQLNDSTQYYMEKISEIGAEAFLPSEQDVLRSRVRTSGIIEEKYTIDDFKFVMYDVGGQRNERKKWIHCFEGVTAVIFVAAISEFDQVLFEDNSTNRMTEALQLFGDIITPHSSTGKWFVETDIILFLNKSDLFEEKIKSKTIESVPEFSDCTAGNDYEAGCKYFEQKFRAAGDAEGGQGSQDIHVHVTNATNTENVNLVFNSCKQIILAQNLGDIGIL